MSSGGGGSKPAPVAVSQGERIQTRLARNQIDYYRGTYQPLEREFLSDANQDHSAKFAGQNAMAATRETTDVLRQAAQGTAPVDTAGIGGAIAGGRVAGMAQGTREKADMQLDGVNLGLGATADASRSLSQAGQSQTSAAIDATRLELMKQQAKNDQRAAVLGAIGQVGGTYVGYKAPEWKAASQAKADAAAALKKSLTAGSTQAGYTDADYKKWVAGQRKK